jgi:TolB-like protein/DNA-binding winged helix-turn-helix (wHTH) protein/Tfp pilus assembly protein PilF
MYTFNPKAVSFVSSGPIKFDEFVLDGDRFELHRGSDNIRLEKIPMELLILLVSRDGKLVTRQEIIDRLWGKDVFVDTEHGINTAIRKVRQALKDDPENPRYLQTVTGKGYRFIAECKNGNASSSESAEAPSAIADPPRKELAVVPRKQSWRWVAIVAAGICVVAGTILALNFDGFRNRIFSGSQIGPIHSIAVLPLTNLSGDPSQEYFADGMTDEMITALAENHSLRIVSRTSVMQFKGVNRPLHEIAKALDVDGILEGSVMRTNDKVHVNLQLIYAPTDTHVWAQSYDRALNDAIALPDEISQTIAAQAKTPPPPAKAPHSIGPGAHDAYLQGRFFWFMDDYNRSQQNFERAIQLQPDYAAAWSGLADSYAARAVGWEVPPAVAFAKAEEFARKALALDDSSAEAHNTMAAIYLFHDWDWTKAEAESRKCIELNPGLVEGHELLSKILFSQNRDAEALQEQKIATQIDPLSSLEPLGLAYSYIRQPDTAIEYFKQSAQYRRDFWTEFNLSTVYRIKGNDRDSADALEHAFLNINDTKSAADVRLAFKKNGMRGVDEWSLNQQLARAQEQYVSPWVLAWQYAQLQDKEHTLAKLQDAYKEHSSFLVLLQKLPTFDFLHSDERYRTLVKKIGLQPAW